MLTKFHIKNLFDLYSYDIDFDLSHSKVRFITGPNGYGKTTILKILSFVYTGEWQKLIVIPFENVCLEFDDGYNLHINQERYKQAEDDSDESLLRHTVLHVEFKLGESPVSAFTVDSIDDETLSSIDSNVKLYFDSHPIYYIKDGRLYSPDGIPTITKCVEKAKRNFKIGEISCDSKYRKKISVFQSIIENSGFSHKRMEIDPRFGIRFVSDNESKIILNQEELSSGEQHLTVMAFELLFGAPDDSLILIDEPEISFHMLWQLDFLKNLNMILDLRDLQCIVATHSPQIFGMKWELSTDLFQQTESHKEI